MWGYLKLKMAHLIAAELVASWRSGCNVPQCFFRVPALCSITNHTGGTNPPSPGKNGGTVEKVVRSGPSSSSSNSAQLIHVSNRLVGGHVEADILLVFSTLHCTFYQ